MQNGGFLYLNDHHLSHLTNVPVSILYIYDPRTVPHWRLFDPTTRLSWNEDFPVLLRTGGLGDTECIGIEYVVRRLHDMPEALEIPDIYETGPLNESGQMSDNSNSDDGSD